MNHTLLKTILFATFIWAFTWCVFWLCSLAWLHACHPEAYAFFASSMPGTTKSIDNLLLDRFYADKRLSIIICAFGSLVISQSSLLIATLRK
jgi:hypothetical protein